MEDRDTAAVLGLLGEYLRWPSGADADALWRWKHVENVFGRSEVWVGTEDGNVVAVRSFMRWRLVDSSGAPFEAARAVDTVTHPSHRGRGWFRELTEHGVDALQASGVHLIFNTPNGQSGPANARLGWQDLQRPTVWVMPTGPRSLLRMLGSRSAADLRPRPSGIGLPVDEALAVPGVSALLQRRVPPAGSLATDRSGAYLQWRYGNPEHRYRIVVGPGVADEFGAAAVVRTRQRGRGVERSVLEWVGGSDAVQAACADPATFDFALAVGDRPGRRWWRLPVGSPRLVWRRLGGTGAAAVAGASQLALTLGDLEGF